MTLTEADHQARWRDVAVVIVNIVGAAGYPSRLPPISLTSPP